MSYCRWSTPIPELTPDVDVSFEKIMELMMDGYEAYVKYKDDNGIVTSDAYVYESTYGGFVCHWTSKKQNETVSFDTAREMAEYLTQEKEKGMLVPQLAIDALLKKQNG
jgi:hypothetical protein